MSRNVGISSDYFYVTLYVLPKNIQSGHALNRDFELAAK